MTIQRNDNNITPTETEKLIGMLSADGAEMQALFAEAMRVKMAAVGEGIYLRGLIEYSNVCRKNCFYCGIRRDSDCTRYTLTHDQAMDAARYAMRQEYGSVVLQGGENTSPEHINAIEKLLRDITAMSDGSLGITISFGEQTPETYRRWREAGAHRYLLRVESSNPELYARIHPADGVHTFESRIQALRDLREADYMVGTGVMVGVPGQTLADLAGDLLFMRSLDIDMCGMGPYVESHGTPMADAVWPERREGGREAEAEYGLRLPENRLDMTLKMIAALRILMPDINIAAATALEAIDPHGRSRALRAGANVVMLNVTPDDLRANYALYDNKPFSAAVLPEGSRILLGEKGHPLHYGKRGEKTR